MPRTLTREKGETSNICSDQEVLVTVEEQPPPDEVDLMLISFEVELGVLLSPAPAPMQMLQVALDALGRISPADLPEEQALALGAALVTARERVQARALRSLADIARRGLHTQDGYGSPGAWVADQQTSMSRDAVAL